MKIRILLLALSLTLSTLSFSQLPDGSIAPDFTVMDLDGNEHQLYPYLESGKSVILDFSATWCGICWNYHSSHAIEDAYNTYGPAGMDMTMAFFLEGDSNTNDACVRGETSDCSSSTFGDWRAGTSYPVINLTGDELTVKSDYDVTGFPTIIAIAPNKRMYETGRINANEWSSWLTETLALDATAEVVDDMIDLTISGGFGNITYEWSTGATTEDVFGLDPGTYDVTVTEGRGHSVELAGIIVMESVSINCPPDKTGFCELAQFPVYETVDDFVSDGGQIDGPYDLSTFEIISEVFDGSCPEVVTRTYGIADQNGLLSQCSHVILINDEEIPEFTLPTDLTVQELPIVYATVPEIIADGGQVFDSCFMDINATLLAEIILDDGPCASIRRTYQVSDLCGNTATADQDFVVGLSQDALVEFSYTSSELEYMFFASSNFGDSYTWTFPNGAISNEENPSFTFDSEGTYQVCLTVDSPCGSLEYCADIVAMLDIEGVSFSCPGDISTSCSIDDETPYSSIDEWIAAGGVLTGDFDATSFQFITEITNQGFCPEILTRGYRVFDVNGQEFTCEQIITVNDVEAPVFPDLPTVNISSLGEQLYTTYQQLENAAGSVTDNCSVDTSSLELLFELSEGEPCAILTRAYEISDLCGNKSSASQTLLLDLPESTVIDFTTELIELLATFTMESNFGDSFLWSFGDGNNSTEKNPQHNYAEPGTYEVCVTVTVECGSVTSCQELVVEPNSTEDYTLYENLVSVWPNPTNGIFNLEFDAAIQLKAITLFSIDGKLTETPFTLNKKQEVDVSQLEKGMYFLKIQANDKLVIKKLLIQ